MCGTAGFFCLFFNLTVRLMTCDVFSGRSLACCCSCPADCRLLLSVSEADEKECIAYVYTPRIKCCSVKEEEIVYGKKDGTNNNTKY